MRRNLSVTALLAALAVVGPAVAQTPSPTAPPPAHHGILGNIFHRHGSSAMPAPGMSPIAGGIVGNKKTHVYHLPGDKGSMPSVQNRAYFRTEAQAVAAGYHKAGSGAVKTHPAMAGQHHKPLTPPTMAGH